MNVLLVSMAPAHNQLISEDEGHAKLLENPELRAAWSENALARTVGLSIGTYRQRHGLTQTELGALVGMSQSQIARLERMDHTPTFETLLRLCDALGLEVEISIGPRDAVPRPATTTTKDDVCDTTDQAIISVREAR
jgi:DNA-binding XRE family transcriptional regulator